MTFLEYPPSKSLSRRWNNFALNFDFPLGASIPTNGKRTADLLQSMVKSLIGHDMAQPPPKHWQSFGLPFTRHNRKRTTFVRTLPHNIERSSPQTKSRVACNRPTAAGSAYRAEPDTTALSSCPFTDAIADHAILSMYRKDIIGVQRIADVLEQWERPAHDWGDMTAWRLCEPIDNLS